MLVLPTHRVIGGLRGFSLQDFMARSGEQIEYRPVRPRRKDFADAGRFLAGFGQHAMLLATPRDGGVECFVARPRRLADMDRLAADEQPAWRQLDVSILHRLLIGEHLRAWGGEQARIDYCADGLAALARVQDADCDLAAFLQPTPVESVVAIARAGSVMPHKSTYFYPKPATGLVMYDLNDQ